MLLIKKGQEPPSLTEYRKQKYATYDGCNKEPIRENLLAEQGYLCAYCMKRISKDNMKIEHWKPEAILTEAQKLDYSNMLGVCEGHIEGEDGRYDTCDSKKKSTLITVDPTREDHINLIKYRKENGEIYSDDKSINNDLNVTLNLNCKKQYLPQNRKSVLNRVLKELAAQNGQQETWSKTRIQNMLNFYETTDKDGCKQEYAGIVIWYLRKRMKQFTS